VLHWFGNVQQQDYGFEATISTVHSLTTDDHPGYVLTYRAIFGTQRMGADSYRQLRTQGKTPPRPENNPSFVDHQVSLVSEAAINPVVEIDRKVRLLRVSYRGTHWFYYFDLAKRIRESA
jgi:hypothetical protein